MTNIPAEVFIRVMMPYVGYRKKIIVTVRQLSRRYKACLVPYDGFLKTIKWEKLTWKEAVCDGVEYQLSWQRELLRTVERSETIMYQHDTAKDFIITLGMRVREMIGTDNYKYLIYAVLKDDRTIDRGEFDDADADYVEIEVGGTYVIGSLVNERRNTDFIREVWAMLEAEPKYDLVGDV